MVNSKKMHKSTVAVILLSLLLVLSLVLTVTGAWFTDKDSASGTTSLDFGKVDVAAGTVTLTPTLATTGKLQPGDTITVSGTVSSTSTVPLWVRATAVVEIKLGSTVVSASTYGITGASVAFTGLGTKDTTVDGYAWEAGNKNSALSATITMPTDNTSFNALNGNAQKLTVTVTVKIAAVQSGNITKDVAATQLTSLMS